MIYLSGVEIAGGWSKIDEFASVVKNRAYLVVIINLFENDLLKLKREGKILQP